MLFLWRPLRTRIKLFLFLTAIFAEHGSPTLLIVSSLRTLIVKDVSKTLTKETTFSWHIVVWGTAFFFGVVLLTSKHDYVSGLRLEFRVAIEISRVEFPFLI